jgi:hypothetical protein
MSEKDIKPKSNRGGVRPGAGRPSGSKNKINTATTETVLEMLYDKTGRVYEDLLLEDFLKARQTNDGLAHKYHSLLANKLMPDLNRVEISETDDAVAAKALAFQEALAKLVSLDQSTK